MYLILPPLEYLGLLRVTNRGEIGTSEQGVLERSWARRRFLE